MANELNHNQLSKTLVKQYSQFYCGLACLASVVKYYGGNITQEKLRADSGTTLTGTSLLGLYQAALKLGFDAGGYEADTETLKTIGSPVILHIVKGEKLEHFVVCYGYQNGRFIIGDPATGMEHYTPDELEKVWKSKALLKLTPGEKFVTAKNDSGNKRLWFISLIKEDYPVLSIAAFLGLVISALGLATAIFSQKLIDQILPQKDTRKLVMGLVIFAVILLARTLISYIRTVFLVRQGKEMNFRLVSGYFSKLLYLPKPFFDSISTGDMTARLNDASRIQKVVVQLSSQILIDLLVVLVSAGYVFFYSVSAGLLSLLSIPVFGLLAWRYNKRVIRAQRETMQTYAATESKYIDTIKGIKTIKTFGTENLFLKVTNTVYAFFMQKVYALGILSSKMGLWFGLSNTLLFVLIISWAAWLVLGGQLLVGQMMAIITLAGSLGASVINLTMANIQFQEARVAFDRMYEFASSEPEFVPSETENQEISENIELNELKVENLNFRFPGKSLLLNQLSFTLQKGKIVTFFGEIGCGKSTLLGILQRFHKIESGKIAVDSTDWNKFSIPHWRTQVASVSQHVQLFNGTVLENICLEEKPDAQKLVNFCIEHGFHKFFMEFQQNYATIISEGSANLSGGQQQLIALARALYKKPKLLLLDEATAAMDKRSESFVLGLLQKLKKEMMVVFVTHRVQVARHTDYIYTFENKTIVQHGAHNELVKTKNLYSQSFEELIISG